MFDDFEFKSNNVIYPRAHLQPNEFIPLSLVDVAAPIRYTSFAEVFPFRYNLDPSRLQDALVQLAADFPVLTARVCHASGGAPGFLCHAQGFPFSVANWPSGRHQQWPCPACSHELPAAMPNYVQQPPFADPIDVIKVNAGIDAAFKVRLTLLGDGTCVLAVTVAHILLDAGRLVMILQHLSRLYTGQGSASQDASGAVFDRTCLSTQGLLPLLRGKAARITKVQLSVLQAVRGIVFFFRALTIICLAICQAFLSLAGKQRKDSRGWSQRKGWEYINVRPQELFEPFILRPAGNPPQSTASTLSPTVSCYSWEALDLPASQLATIKGRINSRSKAHGVPYVSSSDVLAALAWLIRCELYHVPLPGSVIFIAMDLARNGLPAGAVPKFFVGNAVAAVPVEAPALSSNDASMDKYEQMLTVCTCAIRKAIVDHREDETDAIQTALRIGNVPDELRGFAMKKALTKPLLGFITDRTSFNLEGLDFGEGPPQFNLGLPTWPFNVSTVVSKTPTGSLIQLMLDGQSTPVSGVSALLQTVAPEAFFH